MNTVTINQPRFREISDQPQPRGDLQLAWLASFRAGPAPWPRRVDGSHASLDPLADLKEPVGGVVQLLGAFLSIAAITVMAVAAAAAGPIAVLSVVAFGLALLVMYATGALYHSWAAPPDLERTLHRMDSSAAYLALVGTLTPLGFVVIGGATGWLLWVGAIAVAGAGITLELMKRPPPWAATAVYTAVVLLSCVTFFAIASAVSVGVLALLVIGAMAYAAANLFASGRQLDAPHDRIGWPGRSHALMLAGSALHVWAVTSIIG